MKKRLGALFLSLVVVGVAVALLAPRYFLTPIDDSQIGIRVNNIPGFAGNMESISIPGQHWQVPKLVVIYKIEKLRKSIYMTEQAEIEFQPVGMNNPPVEETLDEETSGLTREQMEEVQKKLNAIDDVNILVHDLSPKGNESVRVKTADGNDVWVPIIVGYKVNEDFAPNVLMNVGGKDGNIDRQMEALVTIMVRGAVRSYLSALSTNEILGEKRITEALAEAQKSLNGSLLVFGLEITSLQYQRVVSHPDVQTVIDRKELAFEEADQYHEESIKARQEAITKKFQAQGEADAMIALAEGRKARVLQEAAAQLAALERQSEAEGVKYKELAEGIGAITTELGKPGGDRHVGLAVAQALQGKKIIVVPSEGALNLLDVNEILQSYGAANLIMNKETKSGAAPKPEPAREKATAPPAPAPMEGGANIEPDSKSGTVEEAFGPPLEELPAAPPAPEPQAEVTEEWEPKDQ